jgi:hypothetical protein
MFIRRTHAHIDMQSSIRYTVKVIEGDEEGLMTITIALPKATQLEGLINNEAD